MLIDHIQTNYPDCLAKIMTNEKKSISKFYFLKSKYRTLYQKFNDIVLLDSTYRTNKQRSRGVTANPKIRRDSDSGEIPVNFARPEKVSVAVIFFIGDREICTVKFTAYKLRCTARPILKKHCRRLKSTVKITAG